ncbi:uncharacterized protein BDZ99DRAFT_528680 [Mytilinidion resinicola]|uniref:Rhodopsin domain-containing protein n=1 Tax=Mytilinidion resinicola TaxID=574789 RepID=A0A6A6Z970_9PEZI|nr:uncharacterized protein BDZ99DRAFT_528680 [Mytilinidion resinicola]KAF2816757.1 hypothetical protein BDZ99DRAFT_528680 [Mytilinidion resinicola]
MSNPRHKPGAVVVAVSYSLIITTLAFAIARFYTTFRRRQGFKLGDWLFLCANIIGLAQSIVVDRAVQKGLGHHINELSASQVDAYFKFLYISQLLSIAVQGLSKASVVILISKLDNKKTTRQQCYIIHGLTAFWVLFSVLTVAFQCGFPSPWVFSKSKCTAGGNLYYVVIVLNIITDAIISTFFLPVIWKLQMSKRERTIVSTIFASRLSVCATSIGECVVLGSYLNSTDFTFKAVAPAILAAVTMNLSILTAGIPNVHRFLADLQTGQMGTRLTEDQIESSGAGSRQRSYFSRSGGKNSKSSNSGLSLKLTPIHRGGVTTTCTTNEGGEGQGRGQRDEVDEDGSTSSLKRNVVMQTREISVDYESNPDYRGGESVEGGGRRRV